MNNLEILYDHYKETCIIAKDNEKARNRLFIIVSIVISMLFLFSYDNNSIIGLIKSWVKDNYGCDLLFSSNIIQAILWILLFFITLRYLGLNSSLDKSYNYIHNLEKKINNQSGYGIIDREGDDYLNNYPVLNNITYYMYRVIVPIVYYFVTILKLKLEYRAQQELNIAMIFQIVLGIFCIILIVTYLIENVIDIVNDLIKKYKKNNNQKCKNNLKLKKNNKIIYKKTGDKNKTKT